MKYQVGDKVLLKNMIVGNQWTIQTLKPILGTVVTITIARDSGKYPYDIYENVDFSFCDDDFVGKVVGNKIVR